VFAEPEQGSPLASALTKLPIARAAEMEMVQGITIADMDGKDVDMDVDVLGGTLCFLSSGVLGLTCVCRHILLVAAGRYVD
jgi:hypothetical protein